MTMTTLEIWRCEHGLEQAYHDISPGDRSEVPLEEIKENCEFEFEERRVV